MRAKAAAHMGCVEADKSPGEVAERIGVARRDRFEQWRAEGGLQLGTHLDRPFGAPRKELLRRISGMNRSTKPGKGKSAQ